MKFDSKHIVETVGIGLVVVSLIFVGIELNQANNIAIREARTEISNIIYDLNRARFEEPQIIQIYEKLRTTSSLMSPEEDMLASALASMHISLWSTINGAVQADLLPEETTEYYKELVRNTFEGYPGIASYVDTSLGGRLQPGASEFFDVLLEQIRIYDDDSQ